jgi:acetyl esterase
MTEPRASRPEHRLHPEIAARVRALEAAATTPPHLLTPAQVRAAFLANRKPALRPAAGLQTTDLSIARADGALVPLRLYRPEGVRPVAAVAYFHGGAFTTGDLDSHDAIACAMALQTGCAVASVDYRVLPEHPFPAAFHDAVAVLRWLPGWAAEQGLPRTQIAAGGDSSGANLAMAAALELLDAVPLRALWLAYPIIGADFDTPSYRENADAPLLTRIRCQKIMADYVGRPLAPDDWRAAPLLSSRVAELPPVVAIAAELDPLRSDVDGLMAALAPGARARSHRIAATGMPHGFLRWFADSPACASLARQSWDALRAVLGAAPVDAGRTRT